MNIAHALNRTLLLMHDEFPKAVPDAVLLRALLGTTVVIAADEATLSTHAGQTAFITAAMLMARSGHIVHLVAPNVLLVGRQPPLSQGWLTDELLRCGADLLPDCSFHIGAPSYEPDLVVALGNSAYDGTGKRTVAINATRWSASLTSGKQRSIWQERQWPFGALAAGALAAGEAFKVSMLKLRALASDPSGLAEKFALTDDITFRLAPEGSPVAHDLGAIDFISGGAITNAALFALARIPDIKATGRVFEPETGDLTNLNRYALMLRSRIGRGKAEDLAEQLGFGFRLEPVNERFTELTAMKAGRLAPIVIVGVDHIPSRWLVQKLAPDFLVVGATTHWSAMASFHVDELGCAQCLHPTDDPTDAPIPTTACVSFWAGLLSATYAVLHRAQGKSDGRHQQIFLTPFRPENCYSAPVPIRHDCPTCRRALVA